MLESDSIEIIGIYLSDRVRTKSGNLISDAWRMIRSSGLSYAIYLALGTLIFELVSSLLPEPDKHSTIKSLAKAQDIEAFSSKDINSPQALGWLKSKSPDVLFSGFFNQKLGIETLSIASLACVNLHPALLPKYKGVDPVFYCFLNDEQVLGATLHRMDATYDTGEILDSLTLDIKEGRSLFWHNIELFKRGVDLLIKWIEQLPEPSKSNPSSQENEFYDSWPTPNQVKQLKIPLFSWKDFRDQSTNKPG